MVKMTALVSKKNVRYDGKTTKEIIAGQEYEVDTTSQDIPEGYFSEKKPKKEKKEKEE